MFSCCSLFWSCSNEINVAADWKEVPVVYGLLDPAAEYNYIRINRAYLNKDGDALSYTGISDSIQFSEDLTVLVTEFQDGIERNTIRFEKVLGDTIGILKDPGSFAQTPNILYRSNYEFKASDFRSVYRYELLIINEKSGKQYRSSTFSPGFLESKSPIRTNRKSVNISDRDNGAIAITYVEGPYVKSYDLVVRFRYQEFKKDDPAQSKVDSVDWVVFKGKETSRITGYAEKSVVVYGKTFYQLLAASLQADTSLARRPLDMAFIFYGATEDLYTYINVNKPSIGIVQKKPEFSNITDGLGVFAGRYVNWYDEVEIRDEMKENLRDSEITEALNFIVN